MKLNKTLLIAAAIAGALTARTLLAEDAPTAPGTNAPSKGEKASCKGKEGCKAKASCKGKEGCKAKESCKAKADADKK